VGRRSGVKVAKHAFDLGERRAKVVGDLLREDGARTTTGSRDGA
jgi:hypothetical protein